MSTDQIGIGSTIWIFDPNRRVYPRDEHGKVPISAGPIYREHWIPIKIVGENRRSWILEYWNKKIPKKGPHHGACFTQKEVDDDVWLSDHRHKVCESVRRCGNADALRAIADIVGYKIP